MNVCTHDALPLATRVLRIAHTVCIVSVYLLTFHVSEKGKGYKMSCAATLVRLCEATCDHKPRSIKPRVVLCEGLCDTLAACQPCLKERTHWVIHDWLGLTESPSQFLVVLLSHDILLCTVLDCFTPAHTRSQRVRSSSYYSYFNDLIH
jgi:hypothetical protein